MFVKEYFLPSFYYILNVNKIIYIKNYFYSSGSQSTLTLSFSLKGAFTNKAFQGLS